MEDLIISTVAPNIFERCVAATKEHLGYIWNYKKNMANLEARAKKLDEERADKSHSVIVAEKDAQKIKDGVKSWQDEADKTSAEATQVINDYKEKGQKKCLMGLCPNLVSRYQLSKRACSKEIEIVGVIGEAGKIKKVSDRAIGLGKEIAMSTKSVIPFESRESVLGDIVKALQDETMNLIGVYGFGGMGKTTLVKQVAKRAEEEKMFEEIVFAPVTQVVELRKIQEKIASTLDLRLNNVSEAESAGLIYGRLKGKKVLVILDDLWEELDLNDVGIPSGAEHMSCKILLTSRTSRVLSLMGTKTDFQLRALEEEEAWRLFEEKTIDVIKDPTFLAIGKKVAKRCAGLPVLIVTTAASLSKRPTVPAWNDALKQLKKMDNKQVHENVNSAMKYISYNHLGKEHKKLFLLCGLVGGNVSIEHLLHYSWGLDMFDGEVATMGEARNRLHAWILDLKESCLLLDSDNQGDRNSIKMHDVVRDVAISIAEKDLNMFTVEVSGGEFSICHMDGVLKRCTAIVFRGCPNLSCFPTQLECPSLELCILSQPHEPYSFNLADTFFEKTCNLKVLDMSELYVSTLPSSLFLLKDLQTFRVDYCHCLKDISIVGELKKLQTLSLVHSGIEELPSGIGQLFELRSLDLSYCRHLRIIPAGLIAGLSRLEELKMRESFDRWDVEDSFNNSGRTNVSLLELNHLLNLTSLEIEVSDAKLLSKDLCFEKWEKYEIIVGDMRDDIWFRRWLGELEVTRKVCLQLSTTSINHLQHVVEKLFKRTQCLYLGELKGVKNVTPELDVNGFPYMKHLRIYRDYEIMYIVNVEYIQQKASFPVLESLHLSHLQELLKICNGPLMEESFYNLKVVELKNCNKLESLFSFSMATRLRCLQEINVSGCSVLEEIIAEKNREDDGVSSNDGVHDKIEFVELRKLSLSCLPKLNNFFAGKIVSTQKKRQKSLTTNVESEEIVSEEAELKSSMPFFRKVLFPKLEELTLSKISNLTHPWSHKLSEMPCCNLTRLTVENCDNLQYLLTPCVSMALVGLRDLIVKSCVKMKNIVVEEEGDTKTEIICFPHLSYLCLESLPNLTTFYSGSVEEGDPNESLDITIQPLFNEKVKLPSLKTLDIGNLNDIKTIWPSMSRRTQSFKMDSPEVLSFQNVREVTVRECKSLEHVFPVSMAQSLNKLEGLSIVDCDEVKTLIGDENYVETPEEVVKATGQVTMTFTFPKLVRLYLDRLPKLKCFYPREHTTEWPVLQFFDVTDCGKISFFDFLNISEKQGDNRFEKVISELEFMILTGQDMRKVLGQYDGHSLQHLFHSLKKLAITEFHGEPGTFPSRFFSIIHNQLQELRVYNCSFQEMFPYEGEAIDHVNSDAQLPQLIELQLLLLDVTECPCLTNLVPPSVSCRSLQYLTIKNCGGLISLMQPSTARSLEHLHFLSISGCERIEQIIGEVKDDEQESSSFGHEIIFNNLWHLELVDLPRLTNFCSSHSYTFNFSELDLVRVEECPNMKTFCGGITTNPKLKSVYLNESRSEKRWGGELNTTIEQIYAEWEAKRLGITIPSTSSNKHFEAEAQGHENSAAEGVIEARMEGQTNQNATNHEKLGSIVDKGKGKEVDVSKQVMEHFEISQETPRSSDPSCSNYAAQGQTLVAYLPPSQHAGASSSQLSPLICNPLAIEEETPCSSDPYCSSYAAYLGPSQHVAASLSHLIPQNNNHPDELGLSLAISGFQESTRLATTLPPTSLSNHFEAEAQAHVNSAEDPAEARMESWDAINQEENVADINEKGKGKELWVSEDCDEYEETPRYSDPSSSNCTAQQTVVASSSQLIPRNNVDPHEEAERLTTNHFEAHAQAHETQAEYRVEQTREVHNATDKKETVVDTCEKAREQSVAACLASSQQVAASPSQLSPQISSPLQEVGLLAIEGEAQALAASTTSPNNHIEEKVQFHDKPRKEGLICKNGATGELVNDDQVCDNGTNPGNEMELCGRATEPMKGSEIGEEGTGEGKDVDTGDKAIKPVKLASTCGQVQEQTIAASQASPDVVASSSSSRPKDIQELDVTKHFIPLMSKVLEILQTQPVRTMSARHVQFMEEASRDLAAMNFSMEWLYPFIDKAKKSLSVVDRTKAISEVELKIAQVEVQLQALKESKNALEEENKVIALSIDLDKPLYED